MVTQPRTRVAWSFVALATLAVACSPDAQNPLAPTDRPAFDEIPHPGGLGIGINVCKIAQDNATIGVPFTFTTSATGGTVNSPVTLTATLIGTIDPNACKTVWTSTASFDDQSQVTITEQVPAGFKLVLVNFSTAPGDPTIAPLDPPTSNSVTVVPRHGMTVFFKNMKVEEPPPPPPPAAAVFLVLDEDAIDNGLRYYTSAGETRFFTDLDVNDDRPRLAQRAQLRFFANNVGATISLVSGQVGDEGWFAPKTIPSDWAAAGPTADGLRNFLGNPSQPYPHNVGNRLGTGSDPEKLLDKIPFVAPLRAEGLWMLIGRTVCAVVYDSDISINYGPLNGSLKGENLGVVAFTVLDVQYLPGFSSGTLPKTTVRIEDANKVCEGPQTLFNNAPEPPTSSEPYDIRPNFAGDNAGYVFVTR